jgi:pimeloyl-ACP methyl ester carboxylesterase
MRQWIAAFLCSCALASVTQAASVNGLDIHSTSAGSGPTIVFVHGWTCDETSWREQVPAFDDDYRVITLDLPGHGKSDSPADGVFSMRLFADAVEAVRAEAGADKIVLVGHSMGGPVIRAYALAYPERVAGLVAADGQLDMRGFGGGRAGGAGGAGGATAAAPRPTLSREQRENTIRSMFIDSTAPELREHILKMMLAAPEATATGARAAMFDPANREGGVIEAPALAIMAGTGRMPDVQRTREVIPKFEAVQVPGTGHFVMMEKPTEFNALLREFLDKIDS